ncbi:MAG: SRPBCC family protein, partial [Myxococcales bacterium]|nr:SRPBCC family protein [Myxococcales bacterium]
MFKKILIALAIAVLAFVVIVAKRPAEFRIERAATIAAPPEAVFPLVNDFHEWRAWSPWEERDPDMQRTYEGPPAGVGAIYAWSGNKDVGAGRNTITESRPNDRIGMKLEFMEPFEATNAVEFTFRPEGDGTRVTWAMSGRNNFVGKAMDLFMNM